MSGIFWHNLSAKEAVKILGSDIEKGLSEKEAEHRLKKFGKNFFGEEKPVTAPKIFFEQFRSPLIYILLIAGIVTIALRDYTDAIVIFGVVLLNTIVGFIQENKVSKTLRELKKIVKYSARVIRRDSEKVIDSSGLVPGDILILSRGEKVAADARIIESDNFKTNEAALTGEWMLTEKHSNALPKETILAERDNMVYMGTIIEDGWARAVVAETGLSSQIGKVALLVKKTKGEKTPFQKKLARFSKIVGIIIASISFFILIAGLAAGKEFIEMFTMSMAVAVAAIPEGLPVAMTVILALGMQRILKKRGLVRKMVATETLGSVSIILTDKTGTLTEAKMKVATATGNKSLTLRAGALASRVFIENSAEPKNKWILRGEPTGRAIFSAAIDAGLSQTEKKISEIIFNPVNKFAAALYLENNEKICYVLGVPEKILEISILEKDEREKLEKQLAGLTKKGLRVLASAYKKIPDLEGEIDSLTFAGFIALKDPLRMEAKEAILSCRQAGIRPIIVTGDHKLTAEAVAKELDFKIKEENILEGKELDNLSDKEFEKILGKILVYARVEPRHKIRIVEAWQKMGQVVAMIGDGVNDAPALKKADVGVALGSGTDVAKETADLVLLNDSFSIIVAAIEEGRAILDNIRKVITYLLSDSFTEVILIVGSLLISWLTNQPWVLPVLASQILWINLIEDGLPNVALAFEPKEKNLMRRPPQKKNIPLLTGEMKTLIFIIGLITDLLLLSLFVWLLKFTNYEISHIRSVIFAGLTIDSLFFIFSCKSLKQNLWQINLFSNKLLLLAWIFGMAMLFSAIYFPPFQIVLKTEPLNFFDWQIVLGLGFANLLLIEATKWYFINKAKIKTKSIL